MPGVKHMVVLMLENRSFDHLLGFLNSPTYQIDGIDGTQVNKDSTGEPVAANNTADFAGDYNPDVAHDFVDVVEQVFGTLTPAPGAQPAMSGFVTSYERKTGKPASAHAVMKCFDPAKVPALTTLAQEYAVCTRWFSSIPGPTLPNRAYAHAATSVGHVDMTVNWWKESKTVYELMVENGQQARIYYSDSTIVMTYGGLINRQNEFFSPSMDDFFSDCKNGKLPAYSFIEPRYNNSEGDEPIAANDQHPDHDVAEGEQLVHDVYQAVRKSPAWNDTMLVIVYDEHGGLYDHVPPPAAVSPDGKNSVDPPFAFDRLGVRVPAIIISPYVAAGTIDTQVYDHSSLIATARKLFLDNWEQTFLTQRDKNANTFEGVLTLDTPRTDTPDISGKHRQAVMGRELTRQATVRKQAASLLSDHQQALLAVAASASGLDASGVSTQNEASQFHEQVKAVLQPRVLIAGGQ